MVSNMESTKKNVSAKKKTKKAFVSSSAKRKILMASIISAVVLICGAYFTYSIGLPAMVLNAGTIAGTDIKVNEFNYYFSQIYGTYINYGMITQDTDLDSVYDQTTGKTYREFLYEQTAAKMQNIILLNEAAKKDGYKPQSVDRQVDAFIESMREYAKTYNRTADQVLSSRYGRGATVRTVMQYMSKELAAEEYSNYLMQTKFVLTQDEMLAMYEATPTDYNNASFHLYYFSGSSDAAATDEEKAAALAQAKETALGVIAASTDPKAFRDACKEAAGETAASLFADDNDPTLQENITKSEVSTQNADLADFLFSADRVQGDKTIVETDQGVYVVYFLSTQLNELPVATYRSLSIPLDTKTGATPEEVQAAVDAAKQVAEGYMTKVTDENSFISLVKKHADVSLAASGGYQNGVTADSLVSEETTEENTALSAWLFSEDRISGDMTIIPGTNAVTLYYFVQTIPEWQSTLLQTHINTSYNEWMDAYMAEPGNGNIINFDTIKFASY
jgi:hypothetical protein